MLVTFLLGHIVTLLVSIVGLRVFVWGRIKNEWEKLLGFLGFFVAVLSGGASGGVLFEVAFPYTGDRPWLVILLVGVMFFDIVVNWLVSFMVAESLVLI